MSRAPVSPNPDLTVGADNKQRWNQPTHRRHGFHNAHRLFRRGFMARSRHVYPLYDAPLSELRELPELEALQLHPAFSAIVCAQGNNILFEAAAPDFNVRSSHSIQSITKLHVHLIVGRLVADGKLDLRKSMGHYLPKIGPAYASATIQDVLDMNIDNAFSEDYSDPLSDCYTEEIALGWRLPADSVEEITLEKFIGTISGPVSKNTTGSADYKSANTDALTLLCASVMEHSLNIEIEKIADAVGYEDAFHISLSPDHLPAFSGGGCLSARDLARFGLLLARRGEDIYGSAFASAPFIDATLSRVAPTLAPPKHWLRYSNHSMTDGRLIGHAGYGGQFLMVDLKTGVSCAYLSVLENDAGYDDNYMAQVALALRKLCSMIANA